MRPVGGTSASRHEKSDGIQIPGAARVMHCGRGRSGARASSHVCSSGTNSGSNSSSSRGGGGSSNSETTLGRFELLRAGPKEFRIHLPSRWDTMLWYWPASCWHQEGGAFNSPDAGERDLGKHNSPRDCDIALCVGGQPMHEPKMLKKCGEWGWKPRP